MMEVVETNGSWSLSPTALVRPSARCFASSSNAQGFAKAAGANSLSAAQSGSIWSQWKSIFFVEVKANAENKDVYVQLFLLCYLF